MAGHVAAMRALRAGQHPLGFDPFGEHDDSRSEASDDHDVEPAGELNSDDEKLASSGVKAGAASSIGGDPAKAVSPPAAAKAEALKALNTLWTSACTAIYEDEDAEVFCVRWSPDDTLLAAGCGDGAVRIFNADSGKLTYVLERDAAMARLPTTCLRFRPPTEVSKTKNVLLVGNADGTVQHWHITSRKCMHTITEENNQVYAIDYGCDGRQFASGGKDYTVRVYDEATKTCVVSLCGGFGKEHAGHSNRIFALKFSPSDAQILLSAGWDNTVLVWDLRTETTLYSLYGPHICGDALDLLGDRLLTGSWRPQQQLEVWDLRAKEVEHHIAWKPSATGPTDPCQVYAAQFSKCEVAGRRLIAAGGSGANELRLFDAETRGAIGRLALPRGVYGLDFSHGGTMLAVAGGDSAVRVLAVPPHGGELRADAEAKAKAAAPHKARGTDEAVELDASALEVD